MKSVGDLIRLAGETATEHYLIPDYQRGYRWRAEVQVKALLEDVKGFMDSKPSGEEIYCLQPVVVTAQSEGEKRIWEVIDGQQRLTTLFLILQALKSEECYTLSFQARAESGEFLQRLIAGEKSDKTPDYHFMSEAYTFIEEWLETERIKSGTGFKRDFEATLCKQVKVIWYEVETSSEGEKIEIFNRLNIGKIPLDDAELIRALFLNQIGIGKQEQDTHEETLRKGIFATEWLEIEYYLRNPSVWGFLFPKEDCAEVPANRILRLFDLLAKGKSKEERATFLYFEKELQKQGTAAEREKEVERFWADTKSLFAFLRACYANRKLYHRMGLGLSLGIIKLPELIEQRREDKDSFLVWIEKQLKEDFRSKISWEKLSYEEDRAKVERVLLLFNVLTLDGMADTWEHRFPFDRYNTEKWSVEHIHPQNAESLATISDPSEWIQRALDSLEGIKELPPIPDQRSFSEVVTGLKELLKHEGKDKKDRFLSLARELEAYLSDDASVHELENLALLSVRSNAALSNNIFPAKRKRLLELEQEGIFIPPCTRNVFLKSYSPPNSFPYLWSKEDKQGYIEAMKKTLAGYILFATPESPISID